MDSYLHIGVLYNISESSIVISESASHENGRDNHELAL